MKSLKARFGGPLECFGVRQPGAAFNFGQLADVVQEEDRLTKGRLAGALQNSKLPKFGTNP